MNFCILDLLPSPEILNTGPAFIKQAYCVYLPEESRKEYIKRLVLKKDKLGAIACYPYVRNIYSRRPGSERYTLQKILSAVVNTKTSPQQMEKDWELILNVWCFEKEVFDKLGFDKKTLNRIAKDLHAKHRQTTKLRALSAESLSVLTVCTFVRVNPAETVGKFLQKPVLVAGRAGPSWVPERKVVFTKKVLDSTSLSGKAIIKSLQSFTPSQWLLFLGLVSELQGTSGFLKEEELEKKLTSVVLLVQAL